MTMVVDGLALSPVLADDLGAHVFRHQVARALWQEWPQRAKALESCGEAGARIRCSCCQAAHLAPYRCGARSCPTCAHIASAVAVDRVAARAERAVELGAATTWEGDGWPRSKQWYMLTLTQQTAGRYGDRSRYELVNLVPAIRRVRRGWGPFWRTTRWGSLVIAPSPYTGRRGSRTRRDVMFAMGLEVAPGGMVHAHASVYGEAVEETELRKLWQAAIGRAGFVKLRRMQAATPDDFRQSLRETLKYVTKGERGPRRHEVAALVERALQRIRRVELGGALRLRGDLASPQSLVYASAQQCEGCGEKGQWEWGGMRAPEYVVENGGFGRDHIAQTARYIREPTERRDALLDHHFGSDRLAGWRSQDVAAD